MTLSKINISSLLIIIIDNLEKPIKDKNRNCPYLLHFQFFKL